DRPERPREIGEGGKVPGAEELQAAHEVVERDETEDRRRVPPLGPADAATVARVGASERHVDVVPQPVSEGDVPAPPEIGDAVGEERSIEVLRECHAREEAEAD